MIQRSGKSPILQNQEQKPDQQKKVLPDSGAPVSAKVYLFPQDHLLSEESVDEILMEYIFGNVIGQNPKDGTKIQLNLSLSPEGDLIGRVICFCEVEYSSAKCSLHNELRMTLRSENHLGEYSFNYFFTHPNDFKI